VDEIDEQKALHPTMSREQLRVESTLVGVVDHLDWMDIDFQELLAFGIQEPMERLATLDIENESTPVLRKANKALDGYELRFQQAASALLSLRSFLDRANLEPIEHLFPVDGYRKRADFRRWLEVPKLARLRQGMADPN
jgi:hypothetical protein